MQLGDARSGKLAGNITGFGRTLRRAGVRMDSARIALAQQAAQLVGVASKADLGAALEAVLVSREQDRGVFRELFEAYFRDPEVANKLLAQMLPSAEGKAEPAKRRPRVREALSPQQAFGRQAPKMQDKEVDFDAAMTASDLSVLKHADFNALSAAEYHLVERLARDVALPVPCIAGRRTRPGWRGAQLHWAGVMRHAARTGGELLQLRRLQRQRGAFAVAGAGRCVGFDGTLRAAAAGLSARRHPRFYGRKGRRDVFAFGTHLTDLTPAFRHADTDAMLAAASAAIDDFAGGTRLGESLAGLRRHHARRLVGGRTLVLLITDGLDTGEPEELSRELDWLRLHSRRLLWLNPLLRFSGYAPLARGAAVLHRQAAWHAGGAQSRASCRTWPPAWPPS